MDEFEQGRPAADELAPNENVNLVEPTSVSSAESANQTLSPRSRFSGLEIFELDEYLRREQTAKQLGRLIGSS